MRIWQDDPEPPEPFDGSECTECGRGIPYVGLCDSCAAEIAAEAEYQEEPDPSDRPGYCSRCSCGDSACDGCHCDYDCHGACVVDTREPALESIKRGGQYLAPGEK